MKRYWLILLSLGLVMAFSVSAFAVDVKFSGEYYAAGALLKRVDVTNENDAGTHFFWQRARFGTDFVVSPCLKLVTRFDVQERVWGDYYETNQKTSGGVVDNQENIEFDLAVLDYTSPIGLFLIGYQEDYTWGTVFGNRGTDPTVAQIKYFLPVGPVTLFAGYAKEQENNKNIYSPATSPYTVSDADYDSYRLAVVYSFKQEKAQGDAGVLLLINRDAEYRPAAGFQVNLNKLVPYAKAKIGPVAFQAEAGYAFGKARKYDDGVSGTDVDISAWDLFLDATLNLGPAYVGGTVVYLSGDDPDTTDKAEGSSVTAASRINSAGLDWNPCLILFNNDPIKKKVGGIVGNSSTAVGAEMQNAYFGQLRGGILPVPQLDIMASISYAKADKVPTGWDKEYGYEIDVTGTYKITNNLSYMLGFGYLFTGDYFKGASSSNNIEDDYMLINKLTLNF
jgi:hypothetical protein